MKRKIIALIGMTALSLCAETITLPDHFFASFIQTVTNPKNKVIRYEGEVIYGGGGSLKWIYAKPTKKEVCTDGKEILVVDHDLEQTSAYRIEKGFDLTHIVSRAKLYKKDIFVTEYEGKRYTIKIDSRGRLHSVAYYDDLDNKVQILFTHVKYGKGTLPSSRLKCNYPASYDMIRG